MAYFCKSWPAGSFMEGSGERAGVKEAIFFTVLAVPTGLLQEVQQSTTTLDLMAMASGYRSDAS